MFARTHRGVTVAAVVFGLLVAGCGSQASSSSPHDELSASIQKLGDNKQLSATVTLDASPSDLQALSTSSGSPVDPKVAGLLAAGNVTVELKSDKNLSDLTGNSASTTAMHLAATVNGKAVLEVTNVANTLYLRADVSKIAELAGKPQALSELQSRAASLPAFAKAALAGQWVSINGDAARGLLSQLGGSSASPNPQQQRKVLDQVTAVLQRDVTTTRVSTGGAKGDHLVLTGNLRKLGTDLANAVSSAVPASSAASSQLKPGSLPDKQVKVDAWVKDGQLSEVSVDLVQFADAKQAAALQGKHVPLVMTFRTSGVNIAAPSGATPVDLSQLLPLVGALSSSSSA